MYVLSHYPIHIFFYFACHTRRLFYTFFKLLKVLAFSNPNPGNCTHIHPNWEITTIFTSVLKIIWGKLYSTLFLVSLHHPYDYEIIYTVICTSLKVSWTEIQIIFNTIIFNVTLSRYTTISLIQGSRSIWEKPLKQIWLQSRKTLEPN